MPEDQVDTTEQEQEQQTDDQPETGQAQEQESKETLFSQEQVNQMIANEKRKWQRQRKKTTQPKPQEESTDPKYEALEQQIRSMNYENWAYRKGLTEKQARILRGVVDLANPDTFEETLSEYAEELNLAPQGDKGDAAASQQSTGEAKGSNPQPVRERPRISGDLTPAELRQMANEDPNKAYQEVRKQHIKLSPTGNLPIPQIKKR
jgi:hypothetical protein